MPQVTPYHIPPLWHLFKSPSHPVEPWPPRPREQSLKRRGAWRPKQGVSLGAKVRWSLLSKNIPLNVRLFDTSRWTTNSHKESQGKNCWDARGKLQWSWPHSRYEWNTSASNRGWLTCTCKYFPKTAKNTDLEWSDLGSFRFLKLWAARKLDRIHLRPSSTRNAKIYFGFIKKGKISLCQ